MHEQSAQHNNDELSAPLHEQQESTVSHGHPPLSTWRHSRSPTVLARPSHFSIAKSSAFGNRLDPLERGLVGGNAGFFLVPLLGYYSFRSTFADGADGGAVCGLCDSSEGGLRVYKGLRDPCFLEEC